MKPVVAQRLLGALEAKPGEFVPTRDLLLAVYGPGCDPSHVSEHPRYRTFKVHLCRLRRKHPLETRWAGGRNGAAYRLKVGDLYR